MAKRTWRRVLQKQFKDIAKWMSDSLDIKSRGEMYQGSSLRSTYIGFSDRRISVNTFYTVYRNHGDLFAVVRELSENTGSSGFRWLNSDDPDAEPNPQEVELANQVFNKKQTFRRWKSELLQAWAITGNAYVLIEKGAGSQRPICLSFLDPRTVSVVTDKHGKIKKWFQRVKGKMQDYQPDEIAHFMSQRDPNSPVFGLSAMEPIFWDVRTDQSAMISNYIFFENDAIPAAHFIIDEEMTDQEQERAVKELQRELKGSENRHKSLAIKGVKDIKQISVSPKDMEFHVLRQFTTEKICSAYGVPKGIIGYTDAINLSNGQEQTRKFWTGTIQPLEETLEEFINITILPKLGIQNIKIKFNERSFENFQTEASTRADLAMGVMTINEIRMRRGLEPLDDAVNGEFVDKPMIYNGAGVISLEDVGVDIEDLPPADLEDAAEREIANIRAKSEDYMYGRKTDGKND